MLVVVHVVHVVFVVVVVVVVEIKKHQRQREHYLPRQGQRGGDCP